MCACVCVILCVCLFVHACGHSHVVERVLMRAAASGVSFRVIIADSRPGLEGKELLRRLSALHIPCAC